MLELAEDELGPPPVPYVWVCGGSQARLEQSAHSDQDNALIIADSMQPEHDSYFASMAKIVTEGLDAVKGMEEITKLILSNFGED